MNSKKTIDWKRKHNLYQQGWYRKNYERAKAIDEKRRRKKGILARNSPEAESKRSELSRKLAMREWCIRDPQGRSYHFWNLANFIRLNPGLFDPDDIKVKMTSKRGGRCRAQGGLSTISPRKNKPNTSWKGWTWAATSAVSGAARDPLERQPILISRSDAARIRIPDFLGRIHIHRVTDIKALTNHLAGRTGKKIIIKKKP
jgi:hypothetical protein